MNILIAYSSGYGATQEISEKIGSILAQEPSFLITVDGIEKVTQVENFDALILGSSVRAGQALANITDFLALHRRELGRKKISLFLVCLMANCPAGREKVEQEYLNPIYRKYPELNYVCSQSFGGKIDFDKLNPVMQMLMERVLEHTGISTHGSVDTRDWNFIAGWAEELKQKLLSA